MEDRRKHEQADRRPADRMHLAELDTSGRDAGPLGQLGDLVQILKRFRDIDARLCLVRHASPTYAT